MKFYFIGNSHVNIFRGSHRLFDQDLLELFRTEHLGPTIAYNFYEHHYPKVLEYLERTQIDKENDYICIVVGEVDCRWHLPKQSEVQNRPINDLVEEAINRFFRCYLDLKERGYKVITWGGHPSTTSGHDDDLNKPVYGDCVTRNKISLYWNDYLKKISDENNVKFLSVMKYLIDDDGLTKMDFFLDYCHLNTWKILPFVNIELNKLFDKEFDLK